eukprot:CAMPEP_0197173080 /NCGR_PEP_ID=MMETSP1423-20130617/135_1 /TAXON_ID=476441 /ORGANISM="Pseudo-nitzschia heimii, Strain UNC1101" /LENGTH=494 /DNA_ID=CAMNT_0042621835 /DNA_START=689 /DNA_END=2173 /DNA_ORIENTATION=+
MASSSSSAAATDADPPITETILGSSGNDDEGVDDIVETLYNTDDQLIGYACKQIVEKNTVESMDLLFYMDVRTPKGYQRQSTNGNNAAVTVVSDPSGDAAGLTPQDTAVAVVQEVLLREMSQEYLIDPDVSKGVRCFDLPVDGSTWIVQMTIEPREFQEVTLFGGCRKLEWDPESQDCKFYEAHMRGSYIGAVARDEDGTPFADVIGYLEDLIDGPELAAEIQRRWEGGEEDESESVLILDAAGGDYETAFLGTPKVTDDPNFAGGDQVRDDLKDPTNIKTGVQSSESQMNGNRGTITLVGGSLVAMFSILIVLMLYVLVKRRRSYQKNHGLPPVGAVCANDTEDGLHYADLQKQHNTDHGGDDLGIVLGDDDDSGVADLDHRQLQYHEDEPHDYSVDDDDERPSDGTRALQMDLGSNLRGQLMGVHGVEEHPPPPGGRNGSLLMATAATTTTSLKSDDQDLDELDLDEADSWAQTDGTIGSLELQLEPITAEV